MKCLIHLLLLIAILNSCASKNKYIKSTLYPGQFLLDSSYYLSNRMKNCDLKIDYMKSIIKQDTEHTKILSHFNYYYLGEISLNILNDRNINKIENLHLYYIDLECLKKLPLNDLLQSLLDKNNYFMVINFLKTEKGKSGRYFFEGVFNGFMCFTLVIEKNAIESFSWCKIENSICK